MRELTEKQLAYIFRTGRCPLCGSDQLYEGAFGGMSQNIWCDTCTGGINLMGPAAAINLGGQVLREALPGTVAPDLDPPEPQRAEPGTSLLRKFFRRHT